MNTIFLSNEEVAAYLRDLLKRLVLLNDETPTIWFPIGPSGGMIAQAAMQLNQDMATRILHIPIAFDRTNDRIKFPLDSDPGQAIRGRCVLLIDGAIHSGRTFIQAYRAVEDLSPKDICSYSLVVGSGSSVMPSYFGLVIGDHDRAIFQRSEFPNNRLPAFGCVRKLADADQARPMITSGEPFIDKFSWGDLLYEMRVDSYRRTYVYERKGQIQGFVSFRVELGESVLVDTLAVDEKRHKQGLGGHLIRWSETCGRNADCSTVRLWAVDSRKDWYERQGYERRGEKMVLDGVGFHLMDKRLLYNLPDDHVLTMGH